MKKRFNIGPPLLLTFSVILACYLLNIGFVKAQEQAAEQAKEIAEISECANCHVDEKITEIFKIHQIDLQAFADREERQGVETNLCADCHGAAENGSNYQQHLLLLSQLTVPGTPQKFKANAAKGVNCNIELSWQPAAEAAEEMQTQGFGYQVFRFESKTVEVSDDSSPVATTTGPYYVDTETVCDKKYYYVVRAKNAVGTSEISSVQKIKKSLSKRQQAELVFQQYQQIKNSATTGDADKTAELSAAMDDLSKALEWMVPGDASDCVSCHMNTEGDKTLLERHLHPVILKKDYDKREWSSPDNPAWYKAAKYRECKLCHGPGVKHSIAKTSTSADNLVKKKVPNEITGRELTRRCVACHQQDPDFETSLFSSHKFAQQNNGCLTCHMVTINKANVDEKGKPFTQFQPKGWQQPSYPPKKLLRQPKEMLCGKCHQQQVPPDFGNRLFLDAFQREGVTVQLYPSKHPMVGFTEQHVIGTPEAVHCTDCHNVHAHFAPDANMRQDTTCFNCHSEHAYPQTFAHLALLEEGGCVNCHKPHWSALPKLFERLPSNCRNCHGSADLTHQARFIPNYADGMSCTARNKGCHDISHHAGTDSKGIK